METCERSPRNHSESSTQPMTSPENLRVELTSLQAKHDLLQAEHDLLQAANDLLQSQNDLLQAENDLLQAEHGTLRDKYGTLTENCDNLESDRCLLDIKYQDLKADFNKKKKLHSDLNDDYNALKKSQSVLSRRFNNVITRNGELNSAAIGTKRVLKDLIEFCEAQTWFYREDLVGCPPFDPTPPGGYAPQDKKCKTM